MPVTPSVPTGASASTPPTQPRGEEPHEHENPTIEAKLEASQDTIEMEVTSIMNDKDDDDRTQPMAVPGDSSWDRIPIWSPSSEHNQENDRNGILSHDGVPKDRE